MRISKQYGFTLIELLIVMSIIAVLSTIGVVIYSQVLNNSRDAKRQSDLKFIQSALENYHADQGYYPAILPSTGALASGTKTYLTNIPADPRGNSFYGYVPSPGGCDNTPQKFCTGYCLFANMENPPPPSDVGCILSGNYDYAVTRP